MKNIKIMIKKDIMIPMEYINKQSYDKLVSLNSKVQPLERSILLLINQTTLTTWTKLQLVKSKHRKHNKYTYLGTPMNGHTSNTN